jgi:hypothetical protein
MASQENCWPALVEGSGLSKPGRGFGDWVGEVVVGRIPDGVDGSDATAAALRLSQHETPSQRQGCSNTRGTGGVAQDATKRLRITQSNVPSRMMSWN